MDLADKRTRQVISIHYGPGEGVDRAQANYGDMPGLLRGHDGRLWMPMRTALVIINPDFLPADVKPPLALLKQIKVDDQVMAQYGGVAPLENLADTAKADTQLRLGPDHRHLEFEFTALSFNSPENIRFQYQLQGFDNGWWTRASTGGRVIRGWRRARINFSSAPLQHRRDLERAQGEGLTFIVTPFFWQNWWFWLGVKWWCSLRRWWRWSGWFYFASCG